MRRVRSLTRARVRERGRMRRGTKQGFPFRPRADGHLERPLGHAVGGIRPWVRLGVRREELREACLDRAER